jgi:signal transduction histidine kinase
MILEKINTIALKFLQPLPIDDVYKLVSGEVMKFVGAHYCSIYLEEKGELKKKYASHSTLFNIIAKKNGETYKAYKTKKVQFVDSRAYWDTYPYLKKLKVKTSAFVPLSYQEKCIGVIVLQFTSKKTISKDILDGLKIIGSMGSLAIQKIYAIEQKDKTSEALDYHKAMESALENIYRSGLKFLIPLNLKQTYSTIIHEALRLVDADIGSIFLKIGNKLERVYASSPAMYKIYPRKQGNLYRVFKSKNPIVATYEQLSKDHPEMNKLNIRSNILVPLINQNKTIGVLTLLSSKKNIFTKEDVNVLRLYSPLASLAIRKTQSLDETKRALEVRDLFIAIAAHELRTPLTTLNGYVQLLASRFSKKKSLESRWIENLSHEASRLTHLIQDLLEVNRVQSGKLQYVWTDCSLLALIDKAIINFKFSYPDRQLIVKNSIKKGHDTVIADTNKILQVFNNALNNAGKFSPSETAVLINLTRDEKEFIVEITDRGPGISKENQKKVFQLFYKGNDNIKEGMGLGLYLAKSIIEAHKGKIEIASQEGQGTTVTIYIPAAKL